MTMEKCSSQEGNEKLTTQTTNKMGAPTSAELDRNHFPTRLHMMLSALENDADGLTNAVSWQPHGRVFMIRNADVFMDQILPKWFCRLKFTSFQRQLCLFGFRKLTKKGPDQGGYYHSSFMRDRLDLASTIEPGKIKGKRGRRPKSDESEPDFYHMEPMLERRQPVEKAKLATPSSHLVSRREETKYEGQRLDRGSLIDNIVGGPKDESPEQLSLESLLQQPHYQEELFGEAKLHQPDRLTANVQGEMDWSSFVGTGIQQSLTEESRPILFSHSTSSNTPTYHHQDLFALSHNLTNTAPVSASHTAFARSGAEQGSSIARRLSDISVSDSASAWGWESFSAAAEETTATGAAVASILEQAQAHAPQSLGAMSHGIIGSFPQHQETERNLQRILQEQRLRDLMDLNQKQQNNLRIQQEQLEQQRLELQLRDQEQLAQLRMELRAREQDQQQRDMQQQQHARLLVEPLPRPPPLFKPQNQQSSVARRSSAPAQTQPPHHGWPQQQHSSSTPGSPRNNSDMEWQGQGSHHKGTYQPHRHF